MKTSFATGLDSLLEDHLNLVDGKRVGLVSHPAAITRGLEDNVNALLAAGVHLTALFGPEHGFTAAAGDGTHLDHSHDLRTGLPIYSLYGETLEPTPEMLQQIDVLVFDIQDVGVRFYTFLSTLYYLVRVCGRSCCPLIVLDRPNPIRGTKLGGPLLESGYESFVGILPIPVQHGLTLGELALLINETYAFGADLTIVPMQGWRRAHWFDQTGRTWIPTSPGIPHLETTVVYPGMCFLEGTNLSEGRGTALPFELAGAPWVDGHALAQHLNRIGLVGVHFRPASFTPAASKHRGQVCQGVQIHVLDREVFSPLQTALELIAASQQMAPEKFMFLPPYQGGDPPNHFDLLAGSNKLRLALESSQPVDEIVGSWGPDLAEFTQRRQPYLHYE